MVCADTAHNVAPSKAMASIGALLVLWNSLRMSTEWKFSRPVSKFIRQSREVNEPLFQGGTFNGLTWVARLGFSSGGFFRFVWDGCQISTFDNSESGLVAHSQM